jgi:hypothetical protein
MFGNFSGVGTPGWSLAVSGNAGAACPDAVEEGNTMPHGRRKSTTAPAALEDFVNLPYRLEVFPNDDGVFVVRYPELLGCITQVER